MDKRKHWIAPGLLSLLLVLSLVWGYNQYVIKNKYETALDNQYQRLFYDVKKHVENVQVSLSKALVAASKERNILLFSQIMSDANFAQDKLGQLPISHDEVANTEKFLTQAADYSYYLIQKHLDGEDITPEQREQLTGLQNNSAAFTQELNILHDTMADSSFLYGVASTMGVGGRNQNEGIGSAFQTSLINLETGVAKTPELIYDGPFADQMINRKPVGLPNNTVSMDEAQQAAIEFFGEDRVQGVEPFETGEGAAELRIPAYTFHLYPNNQQRELAVYTGVSQQGGKVLWMANPRPISDPQISVEEAELYAQDYLKQKGFDSMEPNYSLQNDGYSLFNFAVKQDNVTIYPDLIKVKVALDTGEIIGFDASSYYLNHQDRNFATPAISVDEARQNLRTEFNIDSERLALIPKGKNEVLCYEFKGKHKEGDFIIYVNVQNGKEEQILQVIHSENGTLTF
ncbi:MAG: germination protein YpeB [Tissierellaceae bacterium]|nr:germination protein YpeB [Tissierellaceae bacterium]